MSLDSIGAFSVETFTQYTFLTNGNLSVQSESVPNDLHVAEVSKEQPFMVRV